MNPTRRNFLAPFVLASAAAPAMASSGHPGLSMPNLPPTDRPASQGVEGLSDRILESLPRKSSGNEDVDFALIAGPLLDILVEMASDRAAVTKDPVIAASARRIAVLGADELQTLIDYLSSK